MQTTPLPTTAFPAASPAKRSGAASAPNLRSLARRLNGRHDANMTIVYKIQLTKFLAYVLLNQ
jgi:hypothetical protein